MLTAWKERHWSKAFNPLVFAGLPAGIFARPIRLVDPLGRPETGRQARAAGLSQQDALKLRRYIAFFDPAY
jgi:hypothetical protein